METSNKKDQCDSQPHHIKLKGYTHRHSQTHTHLESYTTFHILNPKDYITDIALVKNLCNLSMATIWAFV